MSSSIVSPFPFFTDTTGAPLEGGYIFIGQSNLNPETAPINVFWDSALTIPAGQPIRTVGGYPSRAGTASRMYVSADTYSITVRNKNRVLVFSAFDQSDAPTSVFDISTQLITATASQTTFSLTTFTYLPGTDTLQVFRNGLRLNVGLDYLESNSSTVTLTAPAALGDQFLFQGGTVVSSSLFTSTQLSSVKDYGAVGNGIVDDTAAFSAALAANSAILVPPGTYKLTSTISAPNKYMVMYGSLTGTGSISGIGLISEKNTTNKTINHLVNWNVDASSREQYDSILLKRNYEGVANTDSYYSGGSGIYSYLGYGQDRAAQSQKASGTTNAITAHINVWGAGNGMGTGRTEIVPVAGAAILSRDNIQSGINIYNEFTTIGPKSANASDREGFLSGITSLVMKFCPDNTIDSSHSGSYGATITTRPGDPGFSFESRASDTTYPLRAGLSINGWSGLLATANTGYAAAATDGYEFGILIGGTAGSVWLDPTVRSRIGTGIGVTDYINYAVDIFTKHPNAVAQSGAIRITADAGVSLFGLTTQLDSEARVQTVISSQFGSAIRVGASTHVTSERAGIQYGDWVLGQDSQGNGTKDFSFYDGTTGRIIFGAPAATNLITLPNLPTSATGLSTGQIWRNGNTLQIV